MYCLQCFSSEEVLNNHQSNCIIINNQQAVKMRDKNKNIIKFQNYHKQLPVPFVVYADCEVITDKVDGCTPRNDKSYTESYQKHTDRGYGFKLLCCYDDKFSLPLRIYRSENAVYHFMEKMLEVVKYCNS